MYPTSFQELWILFLRYKGLLGHVYFDCANSIHFAWNFHFCTHRIRFTWIILCPKSYVHPRSWAEPYLQSYGTAGVKILLRPTHLRWEVTPHDDTIALWSLILVPRPFNLRGSGQASDRNEKAWVRGYVVTEVPGNGKCIDTEAKWHLTLTLKPQAVGLVTGVM